MTKRFLDTCTLRRAARNQWLARVALACIIAAAAPVAMAGGGVSCTVFSYTYDFKDGKVLWRTVMNASFDPGVELPGAVAAEFKSLPDPGPESDGCADFYGKDKRHVYYGDNVIEGADVASFQRLATYWARDKAQVYYGDKPVSTRVDTFRVIDDEHATDGENDFFNGKVVPRAKP